MSKFKVGDKVEVVGHFGRDSVNTPYFKVGDKGVIIAINSKPRLIEVDFKNQGNKRVKDEGCWFVENSNSIRLVK